MAFLLRQEIIKEAKERKIFESIQNEMGGLQQSFSVVEKEAILKSLFLFIAHANDISQKELDYFKQTAYFLGYWIADCSTSGIIKKIWGNAINIEIDDAERDNILMNLEVPKKEWYILAMLEALEKKTNSSKKDDDRFLMILGKAGIDGHQINRVLAKRKAMRNTFEEKERNMQRTSNNAKMFEVD